MGKVYGYCRISRKEQSIERQVRNIKSIYPDAVIVKEAFTGARMDRPEWKKLYSKVTTGDTVVFDSVSRMSRTADEGVKIYFELYDRGVKLSFLKEPYIDTAVYGLAVEQTIPSTGNDIADIYISATNKMMKLLAEMQVRKAFDQAEKELIDLRQRTREGIETARLNGKQIGQKKGRKLVIKKEAPAKEMIRKYSKSFDGSLNDSECIKLVGVSKNTFYKYKREMLY